VVQRLLTPRGLKLSAQDDPMLSIAPLVSGTT
jgi:hypothetical protein